jgi:hypothetical protein
MKRTLYGLYLVFLFFGLPALVYAAAGVGFSTWTVLGGAPASGDLMALTDIDDLTGSDDGTSKSMTVGNLQTYMQSNLTFLATTDVDDTPVNGATTDPVSSNWAYDHENGVDPHSVYKLESEMGSASTRDAEDTLTNGSNLPDGAAVVAYLGTYLENVSEDSTPDLGGNLGVGANEIQSTGNVVVQLGDAVGTNVLEVEDSGSVAVATIDSDGNMSDLTSLLVSGVIRGNVNIITTTTGTKSPTADEMRGSFFVADHATPANDVDYTLPTAAAGLSGCFYDNGGGTGGIIIDAAAGDEILLEGTGVGVADAIDSPGVGGDGSNGDFVCLLAIDATSWATLGMSGSWVDGGVD